MAAFKFAASRRVISFGWDESTKFGNSVFSCNFQLEHFDGTIEDVCLRGLSILPHDGTSAALLAHIEERILSYSRCVLTAWIAQHEKEKGAAAGGPSPEKTLACTDCARARSS